MKISVALQILQKQYLKLPGLGGEVLANALLSMIPYGLSLDGKDPREVARSILESKLSVKEAIRMNLGSAFKMDDRVTETKVKHLKRFRNPRSVGRDLKLKSLQIDGLEILIYLYELGYRCIGGQLPTGSGKTNLLAMDALAHILAVKEVGHKSQVATFTSNISIAEQMIEKPDGKEGDLALWLQLLADKGVPVKEFVRILIGPKRASSVEWEKPNAVMSLLSYSGISYEKTLEMLAKSTFSHMQMDEMDVASDTFYAYKPESSLFCVSATMAAQKGWDPFTVCDPVVKKGDPFFSGKLFIETPEERQYLSAHWYEYLGIAISLREGVERGSLCPIRGVSFDIFGIPKVARKLLTLTEGYNGNAIRASREILRDPSVIIDALKSLYLDEDDHFTSYLRGVGSPIPAERPALFFFQRLDVAKEVTRRFKREIAPAVKERWGIETEALFTSGDDRQRTEKIARIMDENDAANTINSVDVIGRGTDIPTTAMVYAFDVYTDSKLSEMFQKVGRGTRVQLSFRKDLGRVTEKDLLLCEVNVDGINEAVSVIASVCDMVNMPPVLQPGSLLLGVWERRQIELSFSRYLYEEGMGVNDALEATAKEFKKELSMDQKFRGMFGEFEEIAKRAPKVRSTPGSGRSGITDTGIDNIKVIPVMRKFAKLSGKKFEDPRMFASIIFRVLNNIKVFSIEDILRLDPVRFGETSCLIFQKVNVMIYSVLSLEKEIGRLNTEKFDAFIAYLRQWNFPETDKDVESIQEFDPFLDQISDKEVGREEYDEVYRFLLENYGTRPIVSCPKTALRTRSVEYYPASMSCRVILRNGSSYEVHSATFKHVERRGAIRLAGRDLMGKLNEHSTKILTIESIEFVDLIKEAQRDIFDRGILVDFSDATINLKYSERMDLVFSARKSTNGREKRFYASHTTDDHNDPTLRLKVIAQYAAWSHSCFLEDDIDLAIENHDLKKFGFKVVESETREEADVLDLGEKYSITVLLVTILSGGTEYSYVMPGRDPSHGLLKALDLTLASRLEGEEGYE